MSDDPRSVRPYGLAPPGYQLPDGAHPGAVHLLVSDLPRSLEYYERVVGLRSARHGEDRAVLVSRDDDRPLVILQTQAGVKRAQRGAFGLYHFAILLPDRASLGRFAAHLAERDVRVGMADHLVSEALYLWDPDGLGIEVYADRPREKWQHHGRELAMTTDPLDVRDLIAAGRGEPWTGAPAGTTIGHVHLHVGSLGEAEAFYHRALGFDKVVWSYPGALFLSAGGYHHHLGTNTWAPGPAAPPDTAHLLEWELVVPSEDAASACADSLAANGYSVERTNGTVLAPDPWGTPVRVRPA